MPSLEAFIESLMKYQNKLINMGKIKGSKVHALAMQDGSSHQNQKSKDKDKRKVHANPKKEGYSKPFNDASGSKGEKGRKGEKFTYFHKGFNLFCKFPWLWRQVTEVTTNQLTGWKLALPT
jgi:hypothetical protein